MTAATENVLLQSLPELKAQTTTFQRCPEYDVHTLRDVTAKKEERDNKHVSEVFCRLVF